ncbi:MAG TPA: hypothetical protein VFO70_01005 [Chitinophagaceae bacterium]|nr:hypothetical protein [Chitinophagaceae bacterium]
MQIQELVIETARHSELQEFYSKVLEMPVSNLEEGNYVVKAGESNLIFRKTVVGEPVYHFAFLIPSNKIEEARDWLRKKVEVLWMGEYKSEIADFASWNEKSVYFFDPAGNVVELISRFDLVNGSEKPFSSNQILSISEVGIVFPEEEFEERANAFLKKYQLSYFLKQPPLPKFRAVGDDQGLFIIVPANRNWYPTDKMAGIFPMEVVFEKNLRFKV